MAAGADGPDPVLRVLKVGPMVHGGHCVARHQGRVIFVRHAIPGETVVARLIGSGPTTGYYWADTVQVLGASEFRRVHPWKLADPLRAYQAGRPPVDGAEFGHIVLDHQRRLKAQVFRDTLGRAGQLHGDDVEVRVMGIVADEPAGMHWRSRTTLAVSPTGRIPLSVPAYDELRLWDLDFTGAVRVDVTAATQGSRVLVSITPGPQASRNPRVLQDQHEGWKRRLAHLPGHVSARITVPSQGSAPGPGVIHLRGDAVIREHVVTEHHGTRTFRAWGSGSWPAHRDAPRTLVESVLAATQAQPGEVVAELYAGAGLFSAFLADAVGPQGAVLSVEPDAQVSQDAKANLGEMPQAVALTGDTEQILAGWLRTRQAGMTEGGLAGRRINTVVLNSANGGPGRTVLRQVHQIHPDRLVHISGNPVSLARDMHHLNQHGWRLKHVDVYDLAPNTHHVISVSLFTPR
ncbi:MULTISPECIES: class I SAM-dependent RNA methyltransferase [Micrococcaceae]|uniref:class I SAM-dependent RNA methyltransferase n=1 Tax=Micrococcaceae TaxID=1268 RepID=UPI001608BEA7|nr:MULTISPECIES: class I SAM-dependent RNA methyltransferase [Micrococcaceae]MBB5748969.1 tRNA/tmRNA/rRNA uracil-C5-methylase (TrmA/RlmC/RlmD family) [Micrococcus sp. TA1]HRO31556.1 class I SAM-dependent RNA methyltransferase [Citricoccus sp.]HRO95265.1 class I SAM-dependent RNA methyltransferase [Citricoccus sp.]